METFTIKCVADGWVTVPANANYCPLLALIHNDDGDHSRINRHLAWKSLDEGLRRIRSSANRHNLSVQVCGNIKVSPTVILRQRPAVSESNPINPFDGISGLDAARWGVSDFYPEHQKALESVIATGKPFDTGWYSVKKEIQSARISRAKHRGPISIEVSSCMDEGHDLIDTALWRAAGGNDVSSSGYEVLSMLGLDEESSRKTIADLADEANLGEDNCSRSDLTIHWNSGLKRVKQGLNECSSETQRELENWYQAAIEICKRFISNKRQSLEANCGNCQYFSPGTADSRFHPGEEAECEHPKYFALFSSNKHFPFSKGCKLWRTRPRKA
jgi:hypothetical protein